MPLRLRTIGDLSETQFLFVKMMTTRAAQLPFMIFVMIEYDNAGKALSTKNGEGEALNK